MLESEDLPATFVDRDLAMMLKNIDSKPQYRDTLMKKLFALDKTGLIRETCVSFRMCHRTLLHNWVLLVIVNHS